MALSQIIDAVHARLTALGVPATKHMGGEHLAKLDAPPRIVWIPVGGTIGPVRGIGENPRRLRTRNVTLEAHVWGSTYDATESLLNSLLVAVHYETHGSYAANSETWPETNGELLAHGRVVVLNLTIQIPVYEPPSMNVTIESVQHDTDLA